MRKRTNLVPESKYSIKCPYTMQAKYITVHNTANDASADNEIKYMIGNNNEVSFHWAVDDIEAVQGVHTNRNAWHCGDGGSGTGNRQSIGVEICYSKSGGPKFDQAEKNAAKLIAELLKEHKLPISAVKRHADWSAKDCPHRTNALGWQRFLNMIQAEYNNLGKPVQPTPPKYVREYVENGEFYITTGKARYICDVPSLDSKDLGTVAPAKWYKYDYVVYNDGRIWVRSCGGYVSVGSYDKNTLKRTEVFAKFR